MWLELWTTGAAYRTQNEMSTQIGFHHWFLGITSSEFSTEQKDIIYFLKWSCSLVEIKKKKYKRKCCCLIEGEHQTRKLIHTKQNIFLTKHPLRSLSIYFIGVLPSPFFDYALIIFFFLLKWNKTSFPLFWKKTWTIIKENWLCQGKLHQNIMIQYFTSWKILPDVQIKEKNSQGFFHVRY